MYSAQLCVVQAPRVATHEEGHAGSRRLCSSMVSARPQVASRAQGNERGSEVMARKSFAPSSAAGMREGRPTVVLAIATTACALAAENYAERGPTGYEGHGRRTLHSQLLCIGVGSASSTVRTAGVPGASNAGEPPGVGHHRPAKDSGRRTASEGHELALSTRCRPTSVRPRRSRPSLCERGIGPPVIGTNFPLVLRELVPASSGFDDSCAQVLVVRSAGGGSFFWSTLPRPAGQPRLDLHIAG